MVSQSETGSFGAKRDNNGARERAELIFRALAPVVSVGQKEPVGPLQGLFRLSAGVLEPCKRNDKKNQAHLRRLRWRLVLFARLADSAPERTGFPTDGFSCGEKIPKSALGDFVKSPLSVCFLRTNGISLVIAPHEPTLVLIQPLGKRLVC